MNKKAIIIGAGVTGLSSGWKLAESGYKVKVIESNPFIGGMSTTFKYKDYFLDLGPHKIFTVLPHINEEIRNLFEDDELLTVKKKSKVFLNKRYLNFPLTFKDIFIGLGIGKCSQCGFGYMFSILKNFYSRKIPISYEEWIIGKFGRPIYNMVLGPYAKKIWGPPEQLSGELAVNRIAAPNIIEMVKQMIFKNKRKTIIINADTFHYPKNGAVEISNKMAQKIRQNHGEITVGTTIREIIFDDDLNINKLSYDNGQIEEMNTHDVLISTIPLANLINLFSGFSSESIHSTVNELRSRNLILFYVALDTDRIMEDNWLFFPEAKYRFNRIFEQKAFSPFMISRGRTVLCVEITCDTDDPIWQSSDDEIYSLLEPQLREVNVIKGNVLETFTKRLTNAYPIYDIHYKDNLKLVLKELNRIHNIFSIGRQGGFSYTGMADSMDIGFSTAEFIITNRNKSQEWLEYCEKFYNYVVID
ncbi:MAG: hypothetical protein A2161_07755 [Candidatus Schekmanbacteria bacterium RBG_13_48_7]|uniref:Amine oxidase domain-containing protein n=1 Tax=Candidatus Schekmanbacteria bacterium RBG_13_48_7 TaxID=1817878 RepID=A0A1F7RXQ9_9BACT|nr:MAG: hypothetical protein A2161_07755 [Candidatus Schekmanbacteria bacterium RBG_13_48_7]